MEKSGKGPPLPPPSFSFSDGRIRKTLAFPIGYARAVLAERERAAIRSVSTIRRRGRPVLAERERAAIRSAGCEYTNIGEVLAERERAAIRSAGYVTDTAAGVLAERERAAIRSRAPKCRKA